MAQKDVLIFGGTGIISSEVCKCALNLGYNVTVVNRGTKKEFIDDRAELLIADIRKEKEEYIIDKLQSVRYDIVIDFLTFNTVQLNKVLNIVKSKCKQYIFISTATVYKEQGPNHVYTENDEIGNELWDYCVKKSECEHALTQIATIFNFNYTIIRPYVTYGITRVPYQFAPIEYYSIIERIKNEKPIPICGKNTICTVTRAADFALGVVGLLNNEAAYGEAVHITADNTTTWEHIICLLGEKLGKKVTLIDINKDWLSEQKNYSIDFSEIIGDKGRNMIFDNSKIKKLVPQYDGSSLIEDNIEEILKYYETETHRRVNYIWDGCVDRLIVNYAKCSNINIELPYVKKGDVKKLIMYCIGRSALLYNICKRIKEFI